MLLGPLIRRALGPCLKAACGRTMSSSAANPSASLAFKNLKPLDLRTEDARKARIPLGPSSLIYGVLDNGMEYYVKSNPKPKQRAALALGVRIGSAVEEEEERGVAHIVEHLAFSATKAYSNHDIVKFLESIGAEFGACQNAYTSADETVFELLVPIDRPQLLSQALAVLAEFSSEVRVSSEDLEKERGAVLEEWRQRRNAAGRMQDAHWTLLMQGSQYAERQPIGLEKVIRGVSADTVKKFYKRWYRPEHMAVVAVGDFAAPEEVVALIKEHFESKRAHGNEEGGKSTPIPTFPFVPHQEPRFSIFAEKESSGSAVMMSCKLAVEDMEAVGDYRAFLAEEMFHLALNQRFFKISRRPSPPFFSASSGCEPLTATTRAFMAAASCANRGTLPALESMLTEIARIRLHGFSAREVALVRSLYVANMESAYLERDQMQSTSVRDEYIQHFLRKEPVPGIEYEAQMAKSLLPEITAEELSQIAHSYGLDCSCVIKTVEPRANASLDEVKGVIAKVAAMEAACSIPTWDEDIIPENIVEKMPTPGTIVSRTESLELGATELILSNGMRVCYKCTDFLDDQVLISGFSFGGLSEVPKAEYHSCAMAPLIAGEIGVFGFKPPILIDMLAGKRADVSTKISSYLREFSADCSPSDLETGLQLIYQLFATRTEASPSDVAVVMQMARESVIAKLADPISAYANRVKELNYGNSFYFKPMTVRHLSRVDPKKACTFFDQCFRDPSRFQVTLVGNLDPATAIPLIQLYLGGIPLPEEKTMKHERDELTPLPFQFPQGVIREEVRRTMVEAQGRAQITFPLQIGGPKVLEEIHWTGFICKLLESRIMHVLRFKHGQVYSVSVSSFLGGTRPSRKDSIRGDIAVRFSCDPDTSWNLVDLALEEVERLQEEGPTEADVATVLELEQRSYEMGLQENGEWLGRLMQAYQSRVYTGDLAAALQAHDTGRETVIKELTASTMQEALRRFLPLPGRSQYTAVILMPQSPLWRRLLSLPPKPSPGLTYESKVLIGSAAAAACTFVAWKYLYR